MVVFQCEKWFVYQTIWFKALLLRFFSENWRKFLILLIIALKLSHHFNLRYFFSWEDENNWLLKLWFFKTSETPLTQFSKFNNFFWVCWFLGKSLSNFVPPVWKLHNPYCHNFSTSDTCTSTKWKSKQTSEANLSFKKT